MMELIFVLTVIFVPFLVAWGIEGFPLPYVIAKSISSKRSLSYDALATYLAWENIPASSRPANPFEMLKTLDLRYGLEPAGVSKITYNYGHFNGRSRRCDCTVWTDGPNKCSKYPDMYEIRQGFNDITNTIVERNKAIEVKAREEGYATSAADVTLYVERLKAEAEIERQVTKEIL